MGESLEAMRPERGSIHEGAKMDSTHKQGLRKACCAQKIDLEKKRKKNSSSVLLGLERPKEHTKTMHCANHIWKLSKRQGEKKRMNNLYFS